MIPVFIDFVTRNFYRRKAAAVRLPQTTAMFSMMGNCSLKDKEPKLSATR